MTLETTYVAMHPETSFNSRWRLSNDVLFGIRKTQLPALSTGRFSVSEGSFSFKTPPLERTSSDQGTLPTLTNEPKAAYFRPRTRGILQCGLLSMAVTR